MVNVLSGVGENATIPSSEGSRGEVSVSKMLDEEAKQLEGEFGRVHYRAIRYRILQGLTDGRSTISWSELSLMETYLREVIRRCMGDIVDRVAVTNKESAGHTMQIDLVLEDIVRNAILGYRVPQSGKDEPLRGELANLK